MNTKILVIDDDPILAGLLKMILELEGYHVVLAEDGDTGLKKVQAERFDLVMLDLVMPRMDGMKFLRMLSDSGSTRPPIMIVSSAIEEQVTSQHRALGVIDIARKPIDPANMITRVKAALAASESTGEAS